MSLELAVHIPCLTVVLAAKARFASMACMIYTILLFARWRVPQLVGGARWVLDHVGFGPPISVAPRRPSGGRSARGLPKAVAEC